MGSDISRSTFVPAKHYSAVRQQQGRVNLDADWNEQIDIAAHRVETEAFDIVGLAGAPRDNGGFLLQGISQGSWIANTAFTQGDIIIDSNGGVEIAVSPGTSDAKPPAWPTTLGSAPVTDGTTGLTWQLIAGDLTISPGRIYVDGILCELEATPLPILNFTGDGTGPGGTQVQVPQLLVDGVTLASGQWVFISAQGGSAPSPLLVQITAVNAAVNSLTFAANVSAFGSPNTNPQLQRIVTYATQPDYPSAPPAPSSGTSLVYLDVWQRTITQLEDGHIQEIALGGPDTTTRTKTVWQVKLVDVSNAGPVACATPSSSISAWQQLIQPSAGLLSNGLVQSSSSGPCRLNPNTGFTGMENQLYRVEIHKPGPVGTATFKWSRDNASVSTAVTAINPTTSSGGASTSQLTVLNTGSDAVLSFSPGDWIEVIDDYLELDGSPGELHQIDTNGVDNNRQTITLQTPVSPALLSRFTGSTDYHPRIVRWDQSGKVYQSDNTTVWADLNASANGDIQVPPSGTALILENGITVSFDVNQAGGSLRAGDYWIFAARTADGSIESLAQASPFGVKHHYCRLGMINFGVKGSPSIPWAISDCRRIFPPMADPSVHVTGVFVTGLGALNNDSTVTLQSLFGGISIVCDAPLDPKMVSTSSSGLDTTQMPGRGAQATCFLSVGVPVISNGAVLGFNPLILPATVRLDSSQTTINLTPTNAAINGLVSQITAVCPTFLANLTLKGNFIWELTNPNIYLDGTALGTLYSDTSGQHVGLQLPSGHSQRSGDFGMWFWLTSVPAITVSPTNLDFGNQTVGAPSSPQSVTVTNNTGSDVTVAPITFSPPGDFAETDSCGGVVKANSTCTLIVTFTPAAQGSRSSTMTIPVDSTSYTVNLTGNGTAAFVTANPPSLNFGFHPVGSTSAPQNVTVTNTGNAPLIVTGISTTAPDFTATYVPPPPFVVFPGPIFDRPTQPPLARETRPAAASVPFTSPLVPIGPRVTLPPGAIFVLQPGGSATISVQFSPQSIGAISAILNIVSNAQTSPLPISLSGTSLQKGKEIFDKLPDKLGDKIADKVSDKISDKLGDKVRDIVVRPMPTVATSSPSDATSAEDAGKQKSFISPAERPPVGQPPGKSTKRK